MSEYLTVLHLIVIIRNIKKIIKVKEEAKIGRKKRTTEKKEEKQ